MGRSAHASLFLTLFSCSASFPCKEPVCLSERQVSTMKQCKMPSLAADDELSFSVYLQPSLIYRKSSLLGKHSLLFVYKRHNLLTCTCDFSSVLTGPHGLQTCPLQFLSSLSSCFRKTMSALEFIIRKTRIFPNCPSEQAYTHIILVKMLTMSDVRIPISIMGKNNNNNKGSCLKENCHKGVKAQFL